MSDGIAVGRHSGSQLATMLVATISFIFFLFFSLLSPPPRATKSAEEFQEQKLVMDVPRSFITTQYSFGLWGDTVQCYRYFNVEIISGAIFTQYSISDISTIRLSNHTENQLIFNHKKNIFASTGNTYWAFQWSIQNIGTGKGTLGGSN